MSRLIDADELRKNVLKWMPSDPCGKEEKEFPFETDICASMVMEIDDAPTVQPDIIRCKDCINYIDHRCTVADHHVAPFSCCQSVFGAKMKAGE